MTESQICDYIGCEELAWNVFNSAYYCDVHYEKLANNYKKILIKKMLLKTEIKTEIVKIKITMKCRDNLMDFSIKHNKLINKNYEHDCIGSPSDVINFLIEEYNKTH